LTTSLNEIDRCDGFDVVTLCNKRFVVNININFSGCGSTPIGNCGSGSGASGAETGLDGPETGSTPDCLTTCPDCCELIKSTYQFDLQCIGDTLTTENLIDGSCGSDTFGETGSYCLGQRSDKCTFFYITAIESDFMGVFLLPIDNGASGGLVDFAGISSCDPFLMTGSLLFGRAGAATFAPCLSDCLINSELVVLDPSCITATFTITEALP